MYITIPFKSSQNTIKTEELTFNLCVSKKYKKHDKKIKIS